MLVIQCKRCGIGIKAYPCDVRTGRKKYCSRHCLAKMASLKHGMSRSRLYVIWSDMKSRCINRSNAGFEYYGDKGISVCQQWANSFECFRDWANENGYQDGLEIDRINLEGDYCPSNCRWATRSQQMCNQRKRRDAKTSIYKGVSWCANVSKWRTQLHQFGKTIHIGLFRSEIEAAVAYDKAAKSIYGEFANLNFKEGGGSF